jgi:cell division initiation protein
MTITARDIQLKQFKIRFRGFDVQEVDFFLDQLAEELTNLEIQNERLRERLRNAEKEIESLKEKDEKLKNEFHEINKHYQELKEESGNASRLVISEAIKEADSIIADAKNRAGDFEKQICEMMDQREQIREYARKIVALGKSMLHKDDGTVSED